MVACFTCMCGLFAHAVNAITRKGLFCGGNTCDNISPNRKSMWVIFKCWMGPYTVAGEEGLKRAVQSSGGWWYWLAVKEGRDQRTWHVPEEDGKGACGERLSPWKWTHFLCRREFIFSVNEQSSASEVSRASGIGVKCKSVTETTV